MVSGLVQDALSFVKQRLPQKSTSVNNDSNNKFPGIGGAAGRRPWNADRNVNKAQRYMKLRIQGNVDDILKLVSDDVVLKSSRDGEFRGKAQFEKYVRTVKPTGSWQNASWNDEKKRAEIRGLVRILRIPVAVVAHFGFNRSGQIDSIVVGTQRAQRKR